MHSQPRPATATLLFRLGLGTLFVAHALAKIFVFTPAGTSAFFEEVGLPGALVLPVIAIELVGGLLLVAGLFSRWAALTLAPIMAGATLVHLPNGWMFTNSHGGWEFPAFLVVSCIAFFLDGSDGRFALSSLLPTGSKGTRS